MREIVVELNKEVCAVHHKQAKCKVGIDGVELNACCKEFREILSQKLSDLNKVSAKR